MTGNSFVIFSSEVVCCVDLRRYFVVSVVDVGHQQGPMTGWDFFVGVSPGWPMIEVDALFAEGDRERLA